MQVAEVEADLAQQLERPLWVKADVQDATWNYR
jgi:hypothetical protein